VVLDIIFCLVEKTHNPTHKNADSKTGIGEANNVF
jgi:hypothetical protein